MNKHKHSNHRKQHPIHWHGSMLLAIVALMLTSFKCSDEMLRALRALPVQSAVMENVYLRDAETGHSPVILNIGSKHATVGGR